MSINLPRNSQFFNSDFIIKKISTYFYSIEFTKDTTITSYQNWSENEQPNTYTRLIFDVNEQVWVNTFSTTKIYPTGYLNINNNKYAFVIVGAKYVDNIMIWIVSTKFVLNKSNTFKTGFIEGTFKNKYVYLDDLSYFTKSISDKTFYSQILDGNIRIVYTSCCNYKIYFDKMNTITFTKIYLQNDTYKTIFNPSIDEWANNYYDNLPFESTILLQRFSKKCSFFMKMIKKHM